MNQTILNRMVEMAKALKPAKQELRAFHLAGIFKRNRLVSLAYNTRKTHPKAIRYGYPFATEALHAECLCVIRGKLENYEGHDLVVIRLDNNGKLNQSKPCKFCGELISKMNFDTIAYSDNLGNFKFEYPALPTI